MCESTKIPPSVNLIYLSNIEPKTHFNCTQVMEKLKKIFVHQPNNFLISKVKMYFHCLKVYEKQKF